MSKIEWTVEIMQGQLIFSYQHQKFEIAERDFVTNEYRLATLEEIRTANEEWGKKIDEFLIQE